MFGPCNDTQWHITLVHHHFLKPKTQTSRADSRLVSALQEVAQAHIGGQTTSDTVYCTSKVTIDGTDYNTGKFMSVGVNGGLPMFCKVARIYLVNQNVSLFSVVILTPRM